MATYEQVIKQVEALGDNLVKFLPSTELKALHTVMHDTETIRGIASGLYSGRNGVVVTTNERFFSLRKVAFGVRTLKNFVTKT